MLPGKQKKIQIFLGIDPGLADMGYGLVSEDCGKLTMITYGSIKTAKEEKSENRLLILEQKILEIIKEFKPDFAGIEKLFFGRNVTTGIAIGQARGVALLALAKNNLPIKEFTPLQVKQAVTGYGKADKKQVQQMVKAILKLKEIPKPDDAADALAIAICLSSCCKF